MPERPAEDNARLQKEVTSWLAEQDTPAYLVGGCVRDRMLGRPVYDLDVTVAGDGLATARSLADRFGGAFVPLDEARGTGRAIIGAASGRRFIVDVARMRGPDLRADLADRDFTVNALAADVRAPGEVIDLHAGMADLQARTLRPVSGASIRNDPVRALRAVRLAAELGFALSPETEALIRRDGAAVADVSGERVRDEVARLLALPHSAPHVGTLDELGLLTVVLPALGPLRGLYQAPPHHLDALAHSLETVRCLESLLDSFQEPASGPEVEALRPFAGRVRAHLGQVLSDLRPRLVTLKLAALLHDTGKPSARSEDAPSRFIGHHASGAEMAAAELRRLRFSSAEARLADTIVYHHMRPLLLARQGEVSRRAVYRFFRDTGDAGVDVLLHALADHQATYGLGSVGGPWSALVSLAVRMLEDYWERRSERVFPPPLITGRDLVEGLGLQPGPAVGALLEAVREAQVCGQVHTREEALALVRGRLDDLDARGAG
jgi:poly(A) polymerase